MVSLFEHYCGVNGSQKLKTIDRFASITIEQKCPCSILFRTVNVNNFPLSLKTQVLSVKLVLATSALPEQMIRVIMQRGKQICILSSLPTFLIDSMFCAKQIGLVLIYIKSAKANFEILIIQTIINQNTHFKDCSRALVLCHIQLKAIKLNKNYGIQQFIIMNRQYESIFRTKTLNHHQLKSKILSQFQNYDPKQKHNYDELLYILDQQIHQRCDRDVLQQLFTQAGNSSRQASLQDIVQKYIQNLQTSKVFILRDQYKIKQLTQKQKNIKNRSKSFIFLKMIQASIYTRFTKEPTFQYRIQPTELPAVTLVNALNPIINHQYTLEMELDSFDIIFYQSGIEILRWTFPDEVDLQQGEYSRTIQSQNVTFEVKIKYMPRDQNKAKKQAQQQISDVKEHLQSQCKAFHRLCVFRPFLQKNGERVSSLPVDKGTWYNFTQNVFEYFPFLRQHVKTLFYLLILTILMECWASSFWSMEFLDMIACFYTLSLLLDESLSEYSLKLLILQLSFLILSMKSIWGAVQEPFFAHSQVNKWLLVICIILKVLLILALTVTQIRKDEIDGYKAELITANVAVGAHSDKDKRLSDNVSDD